MKIAEMHSRVSTQIRDSNIAWPIILLVAIDMVSTITSGKPVPTLREGYYSMLVSPAIRGRQWVLRKFNSYISMRCNAAWYSS